MRKHQRHLTGSDPSMSSAPPFRVRLGVIPFSLGIAAVVVAIASGGTARTAVAPTNSSLPTISGTTTTAQALTANPGTWSGSAPITYQYQWLICGANGDKCHDIGGATSQTYTLRSEDAGNTVRVRVIASNSDGSNSATSGATAHIAASSKPTNTSPPTITCTPQARETLGASSGSWTGAAPVTYTYQWRICGANGEQCHDIAGATSSTYQLKDADAGNTVRVVVTATNGGGNTSATSVPSVAIKPAGPTPPPASAGCSASGGKLAVTGITSPARLGIDQFQVSPATITYRTRSMTVRFHVTACGGSVQGALVYATPVPYGMFAAANEQATDSDGWATINLSALSGFPVSTKQELLVMFARARKPGENVLGGISSRRLVSFRVSRG
jgi:hypothetical protein